MPGHDVVLKGSHVTLEPLRPEHAGDLAAAVAPGDDVWTWMTSAPATAEEMRAWIEARIQGRGHGRAMAFAQRDARTGRLMGSTSLFDISEADECAEIGYTWLAAPWRRTGANTEAKLLLMTYAFETLRLKRVQLVTDARNLRSQRAIERLGAVREGLLRNHRRSKDGRLRDSVYYSVTGSEWPAVRERLQGLLRA